MEEKKKMINKIGQYLNQKTQKKDTNQGEPVFEIDKTMQKIDQENMKNLEKFNNKLNKKYKKIPSPLLSAIATKRLFDCYTDKEIGEILNHFGQIKER